MLQNTGTSDIPVPFNVSIHNAKYSQTLQVRSPVLWTQIS